nr:MAG TPA: hypothetical protein [Caudoviricetes sp.]
MVARISRLVIIPDSLQEVTCQDTLVAGLPCGRVDGCKDLSSRDHGSTLAQDHTPDKSRPVVPSSPRPPPTLRVALRRGACRWRAGVCGGYVARARSTRA